MGAARFTYNRCLEAIKKEKKVPAGSQPVEGSLRDRKRAKSAYREARRQYRPDHGRAPLAADYALLHPVYNAVLALIKAHDSNTAK